MEESKFLEAQNLKNQISYLENCIEDLSRKDARICVSWKECIKRINYNGNITNVTEYIPEVRDHVEALPTEIEDKVKELMNNRLEELKQQFKEL
jgi:hypothetical protein